MKICWNAIVKNESKNISTVVRSIAPYVDYYIVSDTGSVDNTIKKIKKEFDKFGIKGEIHKDKWVDFGTNRDIALRYAYKAGMDYIMIIDPDEKLNVAKKELFKEVREKQAPFYAIQRDCGGCLYYLPFLVNLKAEDWIWKYPVHNVLDVRNGKMPHGVSIPPDYAYIYSKPNGGAKTHGVTLREKFQRDVDKLMEYNDKNPDDPRVIFYIAQSYRDIGVADNNPNCKEYDEALKWYKKRIEYDNEDKHEIFYSKYMIAFIYMCRKEFISARLWFDEAYEADPTRLEPIYYLIHMYKNMKQPYTAFNIGHYALLTIGKYELHNSIFMERYIYDWAFFDEYYQVCLLSNHIEEAYNILKQMLKEKVAPKEVLERAQFNYNLIENAIKEGEKMSQLEENKKE